MRWRPELVECLIKLADAVVILPDLQALLHAKAPENEAEIIRYPKA
ncbi:hypothetical protein M2322_004093 [Rhodoblastus acidophilus]|nr:hypothetical protein [Rhodoblastus acidophilus]